MANVSVNPQMITAVDTNDDTLNFTLPNGPGNNSPAFIEIVTGTFKFALDQSASLSSASWTTAGTKFPITITGKLHYQATNAGDQFRISW